MAQWDLKWEINFPTISDNLIDNTWADKYSAHSADLSEQLAGAHPSFYGRARQINSAKEAKPDLPYSVLGSRVFCLLGINACVLTKARN